MVSFRWIVATPLPQRRKDELGRKGVRPSALCFHCFVLHSSVLLNPVCSDTLNVREPRCAEPLRLVHVEELATKSTWICRAEPRFLHCIQMRSNCSGWLDLSRVSPGQSNPQGGPREPAVRTAHPVRLGVPRGCPPGGAAKLCQPEASCCATAASRPSDVMR